MHSHGVFLSFALFCATASTQKAAADHTLVGMRSSDGDDGDEKKRETSRCSRSTPR
jgi:hypothetical protein